MPERYLIREFAETDRQTCAAILSSLPEWFGIDQANDAYINILGSIPTAVATDGDALVGFIALEEHNPKSMEIHVLATQRHRRNSGIGTALVGWAESYCIERGMHWLHVKTRGPSTPDPDYAITRAFYIAKGFEPLFESLTHWGPEDAALTLIKRL